MVKSAHKSIKTQKKTQITRLQNGNSQKHPHGHKLTKVDKVFWTTFQ